MNVRVRKAEYSDLDKVEQLYQELNDHLAAHENYPGWKRDVYPTREDAEEGFRSGGLYVAENQGKIAGTVIFARLYEKCGFQYIGLADLGLEETTGLKWFKIYEKVLIPHPRLAACEQ